MIKTVCGNNVTNKLELILLMDNSIRQRTNLTPKNLLR